MMHTGNCLRCSGNIILFEDVDSHYWQCLLCGRIASILLKRRRGETANKLAA